VQVQVLAVDDEPVVFWDGDDAADRVHRWSGQVGWQPSWGRVSPSGNGTSGRSVIKDVLRPLGTTMDRCYVTDCLPRYHLKNGAGSQGSAMRERYEPFASARGLPGFSLPQRPPRPAFVQQAVRENGEALADQLRASGAEVAVTLGEEAADVFAAIVGAEPVGLRRDGDYGRERRVPTTFGVRAWIPLIHPGLRVPRWRKHHEEWALRARR
jgi:Asp-tRNA(Asn)/Glu-tRNA(Gln) amidotransferase A subunit family amidase